MRRTAALVFGGARTRRAGCAAAGRRFASEAAQPNTRLALFNAGAPGACVVVRRSSSKERHRLVDFGGLGLVAVNLGVEAEINPRFNPCSDDSERRPVDYGGMTITDYLINAVFVFVVLRQARERRLDLRSLVGPVAAMFFVAQQFVHTIPTAGNDLVLIGLLAVVGVALGLMSGFATHVRAGSDGVALARVGWLAGCLLMVGICGRMVFVFAVTHGFEPAVGSFSVSHQIGAAAWPVALVSMAICEVTVRLATIQIRGRRLQATQAPAAVAVAAAA